MGDHLDLECVHAKIVLSSQCLGSREARFVDSETAELGKREDKSDIYYHSTHNTLK